MLSKLTGFLSGLKLSATEWLLVGSATIIAGLVAALKLQGSRLHKAQVDLLSQKFQVTNDKLSKQSSDAHEAYQKALGSYLDARGKV